MTFQVGRTTNRKDNSAIGKCTLPRAARRASSSRWVQRRLFGCVVDQHVERRDLHLVEAVNLDGRNFSLSNQVVHFGTTYTDIFAGSVKRQQQAIIDGERVCVFIWRLLRLALG